MGKIKYQPSWEKKFKWVEPSKKTKTMTVVLILTFL